MTRRFALPAPVAPLVGGAARVGVGVLWVLEGLVKYRAGFGGADILLVADGTAANSRTPWWFAPVSASMQALPDAFGVIIPALEMLLGLALIAGVLTRLAALGSIATLMLYWGSDQLIAQYPVMVVLSAVVLAIPAAAHYNALLLLRRRARTATARGSRPLRRVRENGSVSLFAFGPSRGPSWQIGLQAGVSIAVPIAVMTLLGNPQLGYIAGSGAFLALFGRALPVVERARVLLFVGGGLILSGVLGVAVAHVPVLVNIGIVVLAVVSAALCFGYRIGVPGPLFFLITFGLSATVMRTAPLSVGTYVLSLIAGCVFAYLVTLAPLVRAADRSVRARPLRELLPGPSWDADARALVLRVAIVAAVGVIIGIFLDPGRAYWIVGAGVAVIGLTADRRVAMQRAMHRMLGTIAGAGVYLLLALLHPDGIILALLLGLLQFLIELVVARHYALALTMITPLVLLLVGAATGSIGDLGIAIERVLDTLVGATLGGLSGLLHPRTTPAQQR